MRMNNLIVVLLLWTGLATALAQETSGLSDAKLEEVGRQINEHRNKAGWQPVSREMIDQDKSLLQRAEPELRRIFQQAPPDDRTSGLLWVWIRLRTDQEDSWKTRLKVTDLTQFAERLGSIDIQSKPSNAKIEIDAKPYPDPTNKTVFETPGVHHVILRKTGYKQVDEKVTVQQRKQTPFHRDLVKE